MVSASLLISVEKNRVGPGVAEAAKKLDRCETEHEIVALILTGIRARARKRRRRVENVWEQKKDTGTPWFFVSVASKEFSLAVSLLFATLVGGSQVLCLKDLWALGTSARWSV